MNKYSKIFVIVKSYSGGRIELMCACTSEDRARIKASELIPLSPRDYSISLMTTELIEEIKDANNQNEV